MYSMNKTVIMNIRNQKSSHRWFSCDAPKAVDIENTRTSFEESNIG